MRSHGHASAGLGQRARRGDAQSNSPAGISSAAAGAWTSRLLPPLLAIACAAAVGRYHSAYGRVPARVRDAYTYNSSRVLSAARPTAVVFENVVHADEALHLINASRSGMEPAYVAKTTGPFGLGGVKKASSQRRSNTLRWMPHDDSPEIWALVQRIAAIVGIPSTHAERLQVIRYEPGQEYADHVDGYEGDLAAAHPAGQRLVSTIVYLTSVAKGESRAITELPWIAASAVQSSQLSTCV